MVVSRIQETIASPYEVRSRVQFSSVHILLKRFHGDTFHQLDLVVLFNLEISSVNFHLSLLPHPPASSPHDQSSDFLGPPRPLLLFLTRLADEEPLSCD